ncbi:MAG TPA: hypothetical protein VF265_00320 [Nevskiaceae bacterium]
MARKPTKKSKDEQAPARDDFDDDEAEFSSDDNAVDVPEPVGPDPATERRRDWRDVEKYREERELHKLVRDDLDEP